MKNCPKCGTELADDVAFCTECGEQLEVVEAAPAANAAPATTSNAPKILGIVSIVCAFLFPFAGLVCGIIGLVLCNKEKNATGVQSKFFKLNLIGLILSIVLPIVISTILFVVLVVGLGVLGGMGGYYY